MHLSKGYDLNHNLCNKLLTHACKINLHKISNRKKEDINSWKEKEKLITNIYLHFNMSVRGSWIERRRLWFVSLAKIKCTAHSLSSRLIRHFLQLHDDDSDKDFHF